MDEAVGERRRHAVDDRPVLLAVAAGDHCGAWRERVLPDLSLEAQLEHGDHHHGQRGGEFLEVDEVKRGAAGGGKEGRGRPAGAAVLVAPGNAAEIDGIQKGSADVHVLVAEAVRGLVRHLALAAARWAPDHAGLAGLDQDRKGLGELGGAEGVVRRNRLDIVHGGSGSAMEGAPGRTGIVPRGPPAALRGAGLHVVAEPVAGVRAGTLAAAARCSASLTGTRAAGCVSESRKGRARRRIQGRCRLRSRARALSERGRGERRPRYQRIVPLSVTPCSGGAMLPAASFRVASRLTSKPGSFGIAEVRRQPMR